MSRVNKTHQAGLRTKTMLCEIVFKGYHRHLHFFNFNMVPFYGLLKAK